MVQPAKQGSDKRVHPRVKTSLLGRYMLADRREFPCTIVDVAVGGIALSGAERGAVGETVIVYIDQLGRVEGEIVRHLDDGFAVKLNGGSRTTEKLTRRIAEMEESGTPNPQRERRREPRIATDEPATPAKSPESPEAQVINLSLFGAEIRIRERPAIGELVQIGRLRGRVVRHSKSGVAIEFIDLKDNATLTEHLTEIHLPKVLTRTKQRTPAS
jgi:hypothetical protein